LSFSTPSKLLLYSNLSPDECADRLRKVIDAPALTMFSLSNYRGSKPFLGEVVDRQFLMFSRVFGRGISLALSGTFLPMGRGTKLDGTFDLARPWATVIRLLGLGGLLLVIAEAIKIRHVPPQFDVVFACSATVAAVIGPSLARGLGLNQQRDITDFVCTQLAAGEDASAFESIREQ
jgi:hypothetical protein